MNKYINRALLLTGCALAMTACDDNSWNDKLDGFEEPRPENVQSFDYTLSTFDYKLVSTNSTNKAMASEAGVSKELSAVQNNCYFSPAISPEDYIPAILNDPQFQYFTLSNGSVLNITYRIAGETPEELSALASAYSYKVTEADYQNAWGSETEFAEAFAPSATAAKNIPGILKNAYPEAAAGDFAVVNYNQASADPDFGSVVPPFETSSVLGSIALDQSVDVNAYVSAVSTQGPIVTDASGSVFVFRPTNNSDLKVGDQVNISTTVSSYNYGFQLAQGSTPEVKGTQDVTYPAPKVWTGAEIDAFVTETMAASTPMKPIYSKFTGKVTVSGNYINIIVDGGTVQLSPYGANDALKALLPAGETVTFEGYAMAIASKGKYLNVIITKVGSTDIKALAAASRAGVEVASENLNAVYKYDGTKWAAASGVAVLSHADYQAMGQRYDNLSGELPKTYLQKWLNHNRPYAVQDETIFMVYNYYNGSATTLRSAWFKFDNGEWTPNEGIVEETGQYVKADGKWVFDPSLTLTLPIGTNQPVSTLYYQACVDWVRDNVPNGATYVSSYGNNDYYGGASAYQGNVDLRASAAKKQAPEVYGSMTDEEVQALVRKHFSEECMPGALQTVHPGVKPIEGRDVVFTFYIGWYDGKTHPAKVVYKVTAPNTFTLDSEYWSETEISKTDDIAAIIEKELEEMNK